MSVTRLGKVFRIAVIGLGITAGVTAAIALAIQFGIHLANEWQQYVPLPAAAPPRAADRIIVFAPHCDDETLGCGGLLALAARNGARLRVVLITNGDGYRVGVARAYGTFKVTPDMCIQFAYRRQKETCAALAMLGVERRNVTFLGYPDRGIAALWDKNWAPDELYVSHATRTSHSPYPDAFRPYAPYCGENLLADIERIILNERPTDIYLPHPCDNHPDHWATYCFVTAALAQPSMSNLSIKLHTYLVHRGDWPIPRGERPRDPLAPPHALTGGDTKWESLALPPDVVDMKRRAIRQYKTQTAIERGFLTSFARANEIFGDLPARRVARVSENAIKVDGEPEDWRGIAPTVVDAVGDYVVAGMNKGGDVRAIYACVDTRYLYIRFDCVRRLSRRIQYTVGLRGVGDSEEHHCQIVIRPASQCDQPGILAACKRRTIELAVPLSQFRIYQSVYIRVQTRLVKLTVDNTGWHKLDFGRGASF